MKLKPIIASILWWLGSVFFAFLGIFGVNQFGLLFSAILLFAGIFMNPSFSKLLKNRFYFETTTMMKLAVLLAAIVVLIAIKLDLFGLTPKNTNNISETTTSMSSDIPETKK
jgi:hypothetical protein